MTRNPLKLDPTRTGLIRRAFEAEIYKRFRWLKGEILRAVDAKDGFDLRTKSVRNARFGFESDTRKIGEFGDWFQKKIDTGVIGGTVGDSWSDRYIQDGYEKGAGRAFTDVRKPALASKNGSVSDFFNGSRDEFLRSSFGAPETIEKLNGLVSRTFMDLKGATNVMADQVRRELADGLVRGQGPREIARRMTNRIDKIGRTRANIIARTEIIRAHSEGQLDAMEKLDVVEVGVMVEWSTAGDDRVCQLCQPLEAVVMKIAEARGIIPRHPQCRCTWIPANVGESAKGRKVDTAEGLVPQKRTQAKIAKARNDSLKSEFPKVPLKVAKQSTRWIGGDSKFAKIRPKSVLDAPAVAGPAPPVVGAEPVKKPEPKPEPKPDAPTKIRPGEAGTAEVDRSVPLAERIAADTESTAIREAILAEEKAVYEKLRPDFEEVGELIFQRDQLNKEFTDIYEEITRKVDALTEKLGLSEVQGVNLRSEFTKEAREQLDATLARRHMAADKAKAAELKLQKKEAKLKLNIRKKTALPKEERLKVRAEHRPAHVTRTLNSNGDWTKLVKETPKVKKMGDDALDFVTSMTRSNRSEEVRRFITGKKERAFFRGWNPMPHTPELDFHKLPKMHGTYLSNANNVHTHAHELGHYLEETFPEIRKLGDDFRQMRIKKAAKPDKKMKDVCPGCRYGEKEVGNPDGWTELFGDHSAHYVGKGYPDGSTEIISMGIEQLMRDPVKFAKIDPEYFDFIIAVLRGTI